MYWISVPRLMIRGNMYKFKRNRGKFQRNSVPILKGLYTIFIKEKSLGDSSTAPCYSSFDPLFQYLNLI